jgi:hypothetical protein
MSQQPLHGSQARYFLAVFASQPPVIGFREHHCRRLVVFEQVDRAMLKAILDGGGTTAFEFSDGQCVFHGNAEG